MSDEYQLRKDIDRLEAQLEKARRELESSQQENYNELKGYYENTQVDMSQFRKDDKDVLLNLGYPVFTINDAGDLLVDLPSGMSSSVFTLDSNGNLNCSISNVYSINDDGDVVCDG